MQQILIPIPRFSQATLKMPRLKYFSHKCWLPKVTYIKVKSMNPSRVVAELCVPEVLMLWDLGLENYTLGAESQTCVVPAHFPDCSS